MVKEALDDQVASVTRLIGHVLLSPPNRFGKGRQNRAKHFWRLFRRAVTTLGGLISEPLSLLGAAAIGTCNQAGRQGFRRDEARRPVD